jgi:hypothetical protein
LPLDRLTKIDAGFSILTSSIVLVLSLVSYFAPQAGVQINIPSEIIWGIFVLSLVGFTIFVIILIRQKRYIRRTDRVEAFLFYPKNLAKESQTLEYHQKNYSKEVIVNFKCNPPEAFLLHASDKSYGWLLIQKYTNMWRPEVDNGSKLEDWCKKKWI